MNNLQPGGSIESSNLEEANADQKNTEPSTFTQMKQMLDNMETKYQSSGNKELEWYARVLKSVITKAGIEASKPESDQSIGKLVVDGLLDPHMVFERVQAHEQKAG